MEQLCDHGALHADICSRVRCHFDVRSLLSAGCMRACRELTSTLVQLVLYLGVHSAFVACMRGVVLPRA